jgi:branched-chain amino acid transport system substrate-binding protein
MFALLAAGCGSGSSHGSTSSGTVAASSVTTAVGATAVPETTGSGQTAAGTPIRIGQIATVTVPGSPSSTVSKDVLTAWVKWTNAHGGVDGHPVELFSLDDHYNPGDGVADAQQLVKSDKVVALVGNSAVSSESAFAADLSQSKTPVVGGVAYSAEWLTDPLFYPVGPAQPTLLYGDFYEAKTLASINKIGIILCNTAAVCNASEPFFRADAKALGLDLTSIVQVGTPEASYTAQCLAMQQSGATAVLIAGPPAQQIAFDCSQQGYKPHFLVVDGVGLFPSTAKSTPALNGVVGSISAFPASKEFPQTSTFFQAMKKYYPDYFSKSNLYDQLVGPTAGALAWTSGVAFAQAITNAKVAASAQVTSADVIRGLADFHNDTLGGIAPPLTFGNGTAPNPAGKCWFVMGISDGKYITPDGLRAQCQA